MVQFVPTGDLKHRGGVRWLADADDEAVLQRADEHVAADEEAGAAEHPLVGGAVRPQPLAQTLVQGHGAGGIASKAGMPSAGGSQARRRLAKTVIIGLKIERSSKATALTVFMPGMPLDVPNIRLPHRGQNSRLTVAPESARDS